MYDPVRETIKKLYENANSFYETIRNVLAQSGFQPSYAGISYQEKPQKPSPLEDLISFAKKNRPRFHGKDTKVVFKGPGGREVEIDKNDVPEGQTLKGFIAERLRVSPKKAAGYLKQAQKNSK